jgi:hypothetical protein
VAKSAIVVTKRESVTLPACRHHSTVRVSRHGIAAELQPDSTLLASPRSAITKACCSMVTACYLAGSSAMQQQSDAQNLFVET